MAISRKEQVRLAMDIYSLTEEQAVEYVMERNYHGYNHEQAMEQIKEKSYLWNKENS